MTATAVKARRGPLVARFEAAKEEVEDDLAKREEGDNSPDSFTVLPKPASHASTEASASRLKQASASSMAATRQMVSHRIGRMPRLKLSGLNLTCC